MVVQSSLSFPLFLCLLSLTFYIFYIDEDLEGRGLSIAREAPVLSGNAAEDERKRYGRGSGGPARS